MLEQCSRPEQADEYADCGRYLASLARKHENRDAVQRFQAYVATGIARLQSGEFDVPTPRQNSNNFC